MLASDLKLVVFVTNMLTKAILGAGYLANGSKNCLLDQEFEKLLKACTLEMSKVVDKSIPPEILPGKYTGTKVFSRITDNAVLVQHSGKVYELHKSGWFDELPEHARLDDCAIRCLKTGVVSQELVQDNWFAVAAKEQFIRRMEELK